ncbi:hypothetical protein DICPUDRAFT_154245 [Dictyostelium purpureum]|uniref:Uncharacterized protein n=1 Tax=Dictyostelium purpureum TaxID=5786 RepID=F0ZQU4_DICPU|nr:uncharacterized protein DICPUDRAFT_154245 [Dictyostelium purpureum]EGC33679.1 hypothetical protein DICPUDRAFT_154245 [Dictyostelium purpureum]|eukprot:XP_003289798.1 hypothetical protein DICPUDRAFT_154245 [Dictyostelium purpureum]
MENQLVVLEEKVIQKMMDMGNERLSKQDDNLMADFMKIVQKLMEENYMQSKVIEKINKELIIEKKDKEELVKTNKELAYRVATDGEL